MGVSSHHSPVVIEDGSLRPLFTVARDGGKAVQEPVLSGERLMRFGKYGKSDRREEKVKQWQWLADLMFVSLPSTGNARR